MNKLITTIQLFTISFCFSFIFLECDKSLFDNRSKFLGNYIFTFHTTGYNTVLSIPVDTIYIEKGKIEYSQDENKISIFFLEYLIDEPSLYEDRSIIGEIIEGEFTSTNTLEFHYSNSGLGNSTFTSVTGEKTK